MRRLHFHPIIARGGRALPVKRVKTGDERGVRADFATKTTFRSNGFNKIPQAPSQKNYRGYSGLSGRQQAAEEREQEKRGKSGAPPKSPRAAV